MSLPPIKINPMKTIVGLTHLLIGFSLLLTACTNEKRTPVEKEDWHCCTFITDMPSYSSEEGESFSHLLEIENYSPEMFDQIPFIEIAKKYVDSCTHHLPIKGITFLIDLSEMRAMGQHPANYDYLIPYLVENDGYILNLFFDLDSDTFKIKSAFLYENRDFIPYEIPGNIK